MDQNQQNSQNQSNNNQDLDSLLKEFQSLAVSSEEPAITNENSIQQVNNSVLDGTYSTGVEQNQSVQQTNVVQPLTGTQQMVSTNNTNPVSFQANNSMSVEPAQINTVIGQMQTVTPATVIQPEMSTAVETAVNVEPTQTVIQTPVNTVIEQVPTLPSSTVVQSEISTNTAPMVNTEPVQTVIQTPATNVAVQVQSAQEINQAYQQQIPVHPDMNVSLEGDGGDKIPVDLSNSNSSSSDNNNAVDEKSNIIFMVVIFAILGAFIMFMPKIDSFFNRKPAMEVKPTPTATPTPEENKEKTITCTIPKETGTNLENQKSYKYYYKNSKVTKLEEITTKKYLLVNETNQSTYSTEQATCNSLATTYANILGFSVSCEETDNSFIVKKSYDLSTFVNPTTITINGKSQTLAVSVNFGDDINAVKSKVTASGATCK